MSYREYPEMQRSEPNLLLVQGSMNKMCSSTDILANFNLFSFLKPGIFLLLEKAWFWASGLLPNGLKKWKLEAKHLMLPSQGLQNRQVLSFYCKFLLNVDLQTYG